MLNLYYVDYIKEGKTNIQLLTYNYFVTCSQVAVSWVSTLNLLNYNVQSNIPIFTPKKK